MQVNLIIAPLLLNSFMLHCDSAGSMPQAQPGRRLSKSEHLIVPVPDAPVAGERTEQQRTGGHYSLMPAISAQIAKSCRLRVFTPSKRIPNTT
jgi:hypothetical protein